MMVYLSPDVWGFGGPKKDSETKLDGKLIQRITNFTWHIQM
jgi:hypothetical protein